MPIARSTATKQSPQPSNCHCYDILGVVTQSACIICKIRERELANYGGEITSSGNGSGLSRLLWWILPWIYKS